MASPPSAAASPRRSRGLSFRTSRSRPSNVSEGNNPVLDPHDDKVNNNLSTKADPLLAMSEAQPMAVALEESNLGSLRDIPHKDQHGNLITEPDLSNPTRPRFERPLDTIRSFEAAIYGTYSSRPMSFARTDEGDYSRRGSYFGGLNGSNGMPARGYETAYMGRGNQSRPDSYVDGYGSNPPGDSYYPYNQGRPRPRRHSPRANVEQAYGSQNGYQQYSYQKSYDNMASGSGNPEPWNAPDPNFVNGSMERLDQQQRAEERAAAEYGFQGFGPGPNLDHNVQQPANVGGYPVSPGRHPYEKPLPDPTAGASTPAPVPEAATTRRIQRKAANTSDSGEKRKSWFKRRFSKD